MRVLVTGGAGYIGSITAQHLIDEGFDLTILDDLSTGHRAALPERAVFIEGRVQDAAALDRSLQACDAVIHFASLSLVAESVQRPQRYLDENVGAMESLLAGLARKGVRNCVFSSSAAIYGQPSVDIIDERQPTAPINPYGESKLRAEALLARACERQGLAALSLRYFNACGAVGSRGEDHRPESHLIPRICAHLQGRLPDFAVFGDDFPTPDGTAIRDYVHVGDLARAHALALDRLEAGAFHCVNLGTGIGSSVGEIVTAATQVAGRELQIQHAARREGDPARLVASRAMAERFLGWQPKQSTPRRILEDAWRWHREHPEGYGG
jgi:UDP-glucose 4-epimerase